MSPPRKRKLKEALRTIAQNPRLGKVLQEDLVGYFSYRVGTLRIVYTINVLRKIVHVVTIGPRETIYDELTRELSAKSPRD